MDIEIINKLKQKNRELIDIVIEKIRKEYPEDIDLIGLCGSFFTGDFHERSDLDLVVVLNNDRGRGFSKCFILDGVGYDFYGSTWEKLEKMASFDHTFVSHVIDVDIVYTREPQCRERFMKLREKALSIINGPMTKEILGKSKGHMERAILAYGKMMLQEELGTVRKLSGDVIYDLTNAICFLNHSYFKYGVKRQLQEMLAMDRVPKNFEEYYNGVMHTVSVAEIKEASARLIKTVKELYDEIEEEILEKPIPSKERLKGTYEEVWSNWKNKIHYAAEHGDVFLAFSSGCNCQDFYYEMKEERGTAPINLMKDFQASDLTSFEDAFVKAMELYKKEYDRLGMNVAYYHSLEEFRKDYLRTNN